MRQIWSMSMICSSCAKCDVPVYLLAPADTHMPFTISMWIDVFVVLGTYQYVAHIFWYSLKAYKVMLGGLS